MKRLFLFLVAMSAMLALLTGCGAEKPESAVPSEPATSEPTQEPDPTVPVDESVFYFSNEQEYGRLYSQRLDGTELKLIVDAYCYAVRQVGDSVYYLDDRDLWVYHIPTGKTSVLVEKRYFSRRSATAIWKPEKIF